MHVTVVLGDSHRIVSVALRLDKIRRQATLIKICVIIFATSYCGLGDAVLEKVDALIISRKYRYRETSGIVHAIRDTPMANAPLLKSGPANRQQHEVANGRIPVTSLHAKAFFMVESVLSPMHNTFWRVIHM
jgi:hypothetical protein